MTTTGSLKSTIVRTRMLALRMFFRTVGPLHPRYAARVALDLWFTVPPPPPVAPLPAGGEPFTVVSGGARVRGHAWGSGPAVYLVHGWGGRGSQLAAYVEPLVAAGHRVVLFDGPSHGDSDPGAHGPTRTHGLELAHALDAVVARFGPADTVIAHSLGAIATYLTQRLGRLAPGRVVLIAPMVESASLFDAFQAALGFGDRTRSAFDRRVDEFVGISVEEFDARVQAAHVPPVPTLVVHDLSDRQTPYAQARKLVDALPQARLLTTDALGHRRILGDHKVVREVLGFLGHRESSEVVA
ncbi:alpha/beta fold hydrolase [Nocardioides sp.]|uniref:alpha/beta fold hydrolase n=1 Tax=Nocardioides sp. TaxID=35761 RepID=UPI002735E0C1|nr:alpha/beta fold hydrolase [Nocardioides sp.]MDP3890444.1 alpha/beta fold hydrolase [Nocardioides sp.]